MTSRRRQTLIAAAATLLAAAPISTIFNTLNWLFSSLITVALIAGAALGVRALRGRVWAQVLAMIAALIMGLTWFFGGGTGYAFIPTAETFKHFQQLFTLAGQQIQNAYVPADDLQGLLFITTFGVGLVAILVDLFAVGLRRPALAGLPMLAIYSVPVAVYTDSISPVPFVIATIGFLWLLVSDNVDRVRRFGRRFTGEGRGVDVWEPSPLAAAGRRLAVAGLLIAVILPIAVPGMTEGFFSQFGGNGEGGNGRGPGGKVTTVDLYAILDGQLRQSETTALVKVTTDDPAPFYARFGTADDVTGDGFKNRTPSGKPVSDNLPRAEGLDAPGATNRRYRATIEVLKNFDMPMVPVYSVPVTTRKLDASWLYDVDQQVVFSTKSRSPGKKFELEYLRPEYTADALRTAAPLPTSNPVRRQFAVVPPVAQVDQLVEELTKGKTTQYDKVRAIYDYFSEKNGFAYDINAEKGTSGQAIVDFLENKRGFCEQYAAALAWMVRSAQIPARVAFGFTRGNSYSGGVYTLTNKNLHAWTEVYFDGFGWVPFDATPTSSVAGSSPSSWAPDVNAPTTAPGVGQTARPGDQNPVDPSAGPSRPAVDRAGDDFPGGDFAGQTQTPMWVWWSIGGGALALLLLAAPGWRRWRLRRRRAKHAAEVTALPDQPEGVTIVVGDDSAGAIRRKAHAAWAELLDIMIDYRIPVDPAETPRSTAERLVSSQKLPVGVGDQARLLARAEETARYARTPYDASGLVPALKELRRTLAIQAGRWVRLVAVLLPPSVVLSWRTAIENRATRASVRMAAVSAEFRRRMRPLRPRWLRS